MAEDFDCPTGTCEDDEPRCADIEPGDTIDPNSVAHLERNECNACPATPPQARYITVRMRSPHTGYSEMRVLDGYYDCEGNEWKPGYKTMNYMFHGDPHPLLPRDLDNFTFRVVPVNSTIRGWQCRYVNGQIDDETEFMGTFDYADSGFWRGVGGGASRLVGADMIEDMHNDMDVAPHKVNGDYVPNLSRIYCR